LSIERSLCPDANGHHVTNFVTVVSAMAIAMSAPPAGSNVRGDTLRSRYHRIPPLDVVAAADAFNELSWEWDTADIECVQYHCDCR
jgi:hypothetical protein